MIAIPCTHRSAPTGERLAGVPLYACSHPDVAGPCIIDRILPRTDPVTSCHRCRLRTRSNPALAPDPAPDRGRSRSGAGARSGLGSNFRWLQVARCGPLNLPPAKHARALVTIGIGEEAQALLATSRPLMQAYAQRLDADFVEITAAHLSPCHPVTLSPPAWPMSCKYAIPRVLDHYDRIAYVDADVLLRPGCMDLFAACGEHELGAVDELAEHGRDGTEQHYQQFRAALGLAPVELPWYVNCGVLVVPRSHAPLLDPPNRPMPIGHCSEQHHTNAQLLASDLPYRLIDLRCNWQNWWDQGFKRAPADAILHYSAGGAQRRTRVADLAASLRPNPGPALAPDLDPLPPLRSGLAGARDIHPWEMDDRHVAWIAQTLASGRFRRVLECGAFRGKVTRRLLEALTEGQIDELVVCDTSPTPELLDLVSRPGFQNSGQRSVRLNTRPSVEVLAERPDWDLIIIDDDHRLEYVQRLIAVLKSPCHPVTLSPGPALFCHDTAAYFLGPHCAGPVHFKHAFAGRGWSVLEDNLPRPGERTERGLAFLTPDSCLLTPAFSAWQATCG